MNGWLRRGLWVMGSALLGWLSGCAGLLPASAPTAAVTPPLTSTAAVPSGGVYVDVTQILQSPPALARDGSNVLYEKFGNLPVLVVSGDVELVTAAASRVDGSLTVMVDNRSNEDKRTSVWIHPKTTTCRPLERWILSIDNRPEIAERLDFKDGDRVDFLAHSLTLLVLPPP